MTQWVHRRVQGARVVGASNSASFEGVPVIRKRQDGPAFGSEGRGGQGREGERH
jgi:hypothetical protein